MQLVRFNPFSELQKLERDDENIWGMFPSIFETSAMDMYKENGNLVIEANLPNFKKSEIKVTTDNGFLEISAEHSEDTEKKTKRQYYFRESASSYLRRVALPDGIDAYQIDANFDNGILKISMPIVTTNNTKTIDVK